MKFRTKPIVVEAIKFNGENAFEVWGFMGRVDLIDNPEMKQTDHPMIKTSDGLVEASPGDWIIKAPAGDFCVREPGIFAAMYEAIPLSPGDPGYFCDQCPHAMAMHNPDGSCPCGIDCVARRRAAQEAR